MAKGSNDDQDRAMEDHIRSSADASESVVSSSANSSDDESGDNLNEVNDHDQKNLEGGSATKSLEEVRECREGGHMIAARPH